MTFREFTQETLDAVRMVAGQLGDRDVTPMVHFETQDGRRELVGVDPLFFTEDGGVTKLIDTFVVPLIREREIQKVAWTFTSAAGPNMYAGGGHDVAGPAIVRVVVALVMDGEVHETWIAPLLPQVGDWLSLGANTTDGLMVSPVQEALR